MRCLRGNDGESTLSGELVTVESRRGSAFGVQRGSELFLRLGHDIFVDREEQARVGRCEAAMTMLRRRLTMGVGRAEP